MNEITYVLTFFVLGSVFSSFLFHALVVGFKWNINKAVWVAPFALVIVPFVFLIAIPVMFLGEIFQHFGNKILQTGR
jgi:hypothetical protein